MKKPLLVAVTATLISSGAFADFVGEGNGDPTQIPFSESYTSLGLNDSTKSQSGFPAADGLFYSSNTQPLLNNTMNASETLNGASVSSTARSVYGGFYLAHNDVSMHISNAQNADGYYTVAGQGTKTSVEFFAPVDAATVTYHWHVEGNLYQSVNYGTVNSRLDFLSSTDPTENWNDLFNPNIEKLEAFGPGDYTYRISSELNTPISLLYWSSAYAEVDPGTALTGTDADYTADFSDTYQLDQIVLTDTDGNVIHGWYLEDTDSGQEVFNEFGPVETPEPTCVALALFAGCALGRRRR